MMYRQPVHDLLHCLLNKSFSPYHKQSTLPKSVESIQHNNLNQTLFSATTNSNGKVVWLHETTTKPRSACINTTAISVGRPPSAVLYMHQSVTIVTGWTSHLITCTRDASSN